MNGKTTAVGKSCHGPMLAWAVSVSPPVGVGAIGLERRAQGCHITGEGSEQSWATSAPQTVTHFSCSQVLRQASGEALAGLGIPPVLGDLQRDPTDACAPAERYGQGRAGMRHSAAAGFCF